MLPDGVTHTQGYVKDPEEAKRYLAIGDSDSLQEVAKKMDVNRVEVVDKLEERKKIDLSKNVILLSFFFFGTRLLLVLVCQFFELFDDFV